MDLTEGAVRAIHGLITEAAYDTIVKVPDGSGRLLVFDPATKKYTETSYVLHQRAFRVSSLSSLAALVVMELGFREDTPRLIIMKPNGAVFYPDVAHPTYHTHTYTRQLSTPFRVLAECVGKGHMPQVPFVRLLQKLAPYVVQHPTERSPTGAELVRAYRSVIFDARTTIVSAPFIEDGKSGYAYKLDIETKGARGEASLPTVCYVNVPFSTGDNGDSTVRGYLVRCEMDVAVLDGKTQNEPKSIVFSLTPELEEVVEQAIRDEVAALRVATTDVPLLTIVEDLSPSR